jgi:hypothetical protein
MFHSKSRGGPIVEAMGKWETRSVLQGGEATVFPTAFGRRKFFRGLVPQRAMQPSGVVVHPPGLDQLPYLSQIQEPVLVQAIVLELPVEAFTERVLRGLAVGLSDGIAHRGRSDSRKRHRLIGSAADFDGLEDPPCGRRGYVSVTYDFLSNAATNFCQSSSSLEGDSSNAAASLYQPGFLVDSTRTM